jgi:hypothetical protein
MISSVRHQLRLAGDNPDMDGDGQTTEENDGEDDDCPKRMVPHPI